jgi:hypothetical protein
MVHPSPQCVKFSSANTGGPTPAQRRLPDLFLLPPYMTSTIVPGLACLSAWRPENHRPVTFPYRGVCLVCRPQHLFFPAFPHPFFSAPPPLSLPPGPLYLRLLPFLILMSPPEDTCSVTNIVRLTTVTCAARRTPVLDPSPPTTSPSSSHPPRPRKTLLGSF